MTIPHKRIYIVEDEALISMEIKDHLVNLGYEVCGVVATGEKALEEIPRAGPDLVLMDVHLAGELDGIETADRLNKHDEIPVVFLTAYTSDDVIERAQQASSFGFLVKPFHERELYATVQMALQRCAIEHELRTANENLATGERVFAALALASPVGVFRTDADGAIINVNQRWIQLTGIDSATAAESKWKSAIYALDRGRVTEAWAESVRHGRPFQSEFRFVHSNKTRTWVLGQAEPIPGANGDCAGFMGTLTEITSRKRIELATSALSTYVASLDGADFFAAVAREMADLLDVPASFIAEWAPNSRTEQRTLALVDDGVVVPNIQYAIEGTPCCTALKNESVLIATGAQGHYPNDVYLSLKDYNAYASQPILDDAGNVIGVFGVMSPHSFQDDGSVLTSLKIYTIAIAAAIARQKHRQKYADLFEFAPTGLVMIEDNGDISLVNQQAEEMFGWGRSEMIGQPIEMLVPEEIRKQHGPERERFQQAREVRRAPMAGGSLTGVRKNGEVFPVEIDLSPVEMEGGVMYAIGIRDVSEQRALRDQLARSTKMDAIGKLTGGMAHDFNNHLAIIMGNIDLVRSRVAGDATASRRLEVARQGALRAADLTRSLLAFSRDQPTNPHPTKLSDRVESVVEFLDRALGEDIVLNRHHDRNKWLVNVDAALLDSCILNLANNGRDAMPEGGMLTIRTKDILTDENSESSPKLPCGEYVLLEVSDDGTGMTAETLEQAFEPFFSTKPEGHGTGLGLSMVYGFVSQSSGHIVLDSEPGRGTKVRIYLPRHVGIHGETQVEVVPHRAKSDNPMARSETILLVEDNDLARETAGELVASFGYRVVDVSGCEDALAVLEAGSEPIDLLFTDVVMPGAYRGYDLVEKVQECWPDVGVLMTSGFPGEPIVGAAASVPLISKPYQAADLARLIREALDQRGQPSKAKPTRAR